jgi:hypothetical protein
LFDVAFSELGIAQVRAGAFVELGAHCHGLITFDPHQIAFSHQQLGTAAEGSDDSLAFEQGITGFEWPQIALRVTRIGIAGG